MPLDAIGVKVSRTLADKQKRGVTIKMMVAGARVSTNGFLQINVDTTDLVYKVNEIAEMRHHIAVKGDAVILIHCLRELHYALPATIKILTVAICRVDTELRDIMLLKSGNGEPKNRAELIKQGFYG